jgi:ring-1,2-phenylacetyl-CoA epoxidase subunit PaaC
LNVRASTGLSAGVTEFLLAFADDEHLMGQQHTEWIGVAPFLEEDVAFASIGQDELGHASALYALIAGDDDTAVDQLALRRDPGDYRSAWLVEVPCDDWAAALIRHWLYDAAEELRWELVAGSSLPGLADAVGRALREESFHRRHADALLDALLDVDESRQRLQAELYPLLSLALGLFEPVAGEAQAIAERVTARPFHRELQRWQTRVDERFGQIEWARIPRPAQAARAARSDGFAPLYERMREVIDLDPNARW